MVAYYHHDIVSWMDGTEGLDDGEYRVYHVLVELIYLQEGPIVAHERGLAGRCGQHVLAFRHNLKRLVDKRKLTLTADGKISNKRAEEELAKIGPNPRRTPRAPPANPPPTPRQPPPGRARKPLKRKGVKAPTILDKTRPDSEEPSGSSGEVATRLPPDWQPSVHDRGIAGGRGMMGKVFNDEVAKFRNHWHSKGGPGAKKLNWSAMWETWVINWQGFNGGNNGQDRRVARGGGYGELSARVRATRAHRAAASPVCSGDGLGDSEAVLDVVDAEQRH